MQIARREVIFTSEWAPPHSCIFWFLCKISSWVDLLNHVLRSFVNWKKRSKIILVPSSFFEVPYSSFWTIRISDWISWAFFLGFFGLPRRIRGWKLLRPIQTNRTFKFAPWKKIITVGFHQDDSSSISPQSYFRFILPPNVHLKDRRKAEDYRSIK